MTRATSSSRLAGANLGMALSPRMHSSDFGLLTHASSPKSDECIRGLKAIPRFAPAKRDDEVARVIYRAFANGNSEVRVTVCQVAGELRKIAPEYRYSFAPLLNSPDKSIRTAALQSLGPRSGTFGQDE